MTKEFCVKTTCHTKNGLNQLKSKATVALLCCSFFLMLCDALEAKENTINVTIITELGSIEAELYPDRAPITVANFVANIEAGLYKAGHFYRALNSDSEPTGPLSLIQGGKNMATAERPAIKHEITAMTGLSHTDGILSMGRLAPGSAASEFFICSGDNTALDYSQTDATRPGYAAFGRVTKGMAVVRYILSKPVGNRAPDDPFMAFVRHKRAEIMVPSLLDNSIPMSIELMTQSVALEITEASIQ